MVGPAGSALNKGAQIHLFLTAGPESGYFSHTSYRKKEDMVYRLISQAFGAEITWPIRFSYKLILYCIYISDHIPAYFSFVKKRLFSYVMRIEIRNPSYNVEYTKVLFRFHSL